MFQATAAVQVSCQGQMDLHRIQSIPYPVPSPLPPLLFTAHDARCGVSRKCNLLSPSSLSHSLALSDSSLPTPLKPSLCFRMQDALHSLSALHFQRSSDLKMKLDAPPSNDLCRESNSSSVLVNRWVWGLGDFRCVTVCNSI